LKALVAQQSGCRQDEVEVSKNGEAFFVASAPSWTRPRTFIWVVTSFTNAGWNEVISVEEDGRQN
jgi:hypothetical protein